MPATISTSPKASNVDEISPSLSPQSTASIPSTPNRFPLAFSSGQSGSRLDQNGANNAASDPKRRDPDGHGRFSSLKKPSQPRRSGGFLLDPFVDKVRRRRGSPDLQREDPKPKSDSSNGKRKSDPAEIQTLDRLGTLRNHKSRLHQDLDFTAEDDSFVDGEIQSKRNRDDDTHLGPASSAASGSYRSRHGQNKVSFEEQAERMSGSAPNGFDADRSSVINPAEIVRMALNLNEGRKMNLEPGRLASIPIQDEKRSSFAVVHRKDEVLSGSLRQHLQAQNRSSHTSTPASKSPHDMQSRIQSPSPSSSYHASSLTGSEHQSEYIYHFSPSTIARTEKAKAFFELAHENRRLLEYVPPLDPKLSSQRLGRPYNPLQFLRNRQVRRKHDMRLDFEREGFNDVFRVKNWVDLVDHDSTQAGYHLGDITLLPDWDHSGRRAQHLLRETDHEDPKGESRRLGRFEQAKMDWTFTPAEMLADAYWTEQSDNKSLVESRQGNRIFPNFEKARRDTVSTHFTHDTGLSNETTFSDEQPSKLQDSPEWQRSPKGLRDEGSDLEQESGKIRFSPQTRNRTARVRKHLLKRQKAPSYDPDDNSDSGSDKSAYNSRQHGKHATYANTGPLERHMKDLLDKEATKPDQSRHPAQESSRHSDDAGRRLGMSEDRQARRSQESLNDDESHRRAARKLRGGRRDDAVLTGPHILVSDHGSRGDSKRDSRNARINKELAKIRKADDDKRVKSRTSKFRIIRSRDRSRSRSLTSGNAREDNIRFDQDDKNDSNAPHNGSVDSSDEAHHSSRTKHGQKDLKRPRRSSLGDTRDTTLAEHQAESDVPAQSLQTSSQKNSSGGLTASDIMFKRQPPRPNSKDSAQQQGNAGSLELEGTKAIEPQPSLLDSRHRSVSTNDLQEAKNTRYGTQKLPSFVSFNRNSRRERLSANDVRSDHITRQQEHRKIQRKTSRLGTLAPSPIDTSDVSPTNSSPDLSRRESKRPELLGLETRESYGFLSVDGTKSRRPSRSGTDSTHRSLNRAVNMPNNTPGWRLKNKRAFENSSTLLHRTDWASKDPRRSTTGLHETRNPITRQDIAYVRTLLLSSSVKAKSIIDRANTPRTKPPAFLLDVLASTQGIRRDPGSYSLDLIPRRHEHVVAAQNLSKQLNETVAAFDSSAAHFRDSISGSLDAEINDLRERVGAHLTPRVRNASDEAEAFIARLTTTHTLDVKRVNDAVEDMMRRRRQRLRWLRRVGFAVLEWLVKGVMWWIWLFVFLFKVVRATVVGTFHGLKWMLWL